MKTKYLSMLFPFLLVACSDSDNVEEQPFEPQRINVEGKVEKGPFVSGSTISMQLLDHRLQTVGAMYSTSILDNSGHFSFGAKTLESPFAELTANGYFFNEVLGQLSFGTINLRALVNVDDHRSVNVNLLTHLTSMRIQRLVERGKSFAQANEQAQRELLTAFGLQRYADGDVSQFSLTEGTDYSGALIAVSSLLLADRSEAQLTEFLAKLSLEFADSGKLSKETKNILADNRSFLSDRLNTIAESIVNRYRDLDMEVKVPDLSRFFDWDDDGIAGNELMNEGDKVTLEVDTLVVPFEAGVYKVKVNSPIPLSLTSDEIHDLPSIDTNDEALYAQVEMNMEKRLEKETLIISLTPVKNGATRLVHVPLYDGMGNEVAALVVKETGNGRDGSPELGDAGIGLFLGALRGQGTAFRDLSSAFQMYPQFVNNNNHFAFDDELWGYSDEAWNNLYKAVNIMVMIKDKDLRMHSYFQHYCNVHLAIYYTQMVNTWGNVTYYETPLSPSDPRKRTPKEEIFASLKTNLEQAIEGCEEKHNAALPIEGLNDVFFVSKDVARTALANIYLHEGNYEMAAPLLKKVIDNGYYALEGLDYTNENNFVSFNNDAVEIMKQSKEVIWGTLEQNEYQPSRCIYVMNYPEVLLCYAECLYKLGDIDHARTYLDQVLKDKRVSLTYDDILEGICNARLKIFKYDVNTFAFMQRNRLGEKVYGVEGYRMLFPIPQSEIYGNPDFYQNPGY